MTQAKVFEEALNWQCNKVALGMECLRCWYPYSEAAFSDRGNGEDPFPCNTNKSVLEKHIKEK